MDQSSGQKVEGVYVVKDALGSLMWLGLAALCVLVGLVVQLANGFENFFSGIIFASFFYSLAYVFKSIFQAGNEGYTIDTNNNEFRFPGGRVADDVSDYVSLDWWKQRIGMKHQRVDLSDINHISWQDERYFDDSSQSWKVAYTIGIDGTFGSIQTSFSSKGKRDQLYALLSQVLEMGDPVVVR